MDNGHLPDRRILGNATVVRPSQTVKHKMKGTVNIMIALVVIMIKGPQ